VGGDLADIFVLSLVAVANPTLLAATTVMMLLPSPRRLMAGYLLHRARDRTIPRE
jgi:hypothetical protein